MTSCIFGRSVKKVMSYRSGSVFLSDRSRFAVGELPVRWKKIRTGGYAIAFHNDLLGATIAIDAFCGAGYEDLPLKLLTNHLLSGVTDIKVRRETDFMLDGRGALRTVVDGRMDGVPMVFDIVVLKKNRCNIDFMCIAPPNRYNEAAVDFEAFYSGFRYE